MYVCMYVYILIKFLKYRRLFRLKENTSTEKWENQEILMCGNETCFNGLVGVYEKNILSFGEDANGNYMLIYQYMYHIMNHFF